MKDPRAVGWGTNVYCTACQNNESLFFPASSYSLTVLSKESRVRDSIESAYTPSFFAVMRVIFTPETPRTYALGAVGQCQLC